MCQCDCSVDFSSSCGLLQSGIGLVLDFVEREWRKAPLGEGACFAWGRFANSGPSFVEVKMVDPGFPVPQNRDKGCKTDDS